MASVQDVLSTQKSIEEALFGRMAEFEKQIKSSAVTDTAVTLDKLSTDFKSFKETVCSIFQMLRLLIQSLTCQVEDLDCYNRRNALLFNGVEELENEDCRALVINVIQSTMNLKNIQTSSIQLCHRLGGKDTNRTRPILVRFNDIGTRNIIWNEKKRLKSTPTVLSEFLTKTRQGIFSNARKHFGISHCWTRDGKVFIKLSNNERKRINTLDELSQLMTEHPAMAKKDQLESRSGTPARAQTAEARAPRKNAASKTRKAK